MPKVMHPLYWMTSALFAAQALAFAPQATNTVTKDQATRFEFGHRVVRPALAGAETSAALTKQFGSAVQVERDRKSGVIRVFTLRPDSKFERLSIADGIPAFEQAARNIMTAYRTTFNIDTKDIELDRSALVFDRQDQFLKFRVRRHGVAVQDAIIDVRFKQGAIIQIVNQSFSEASDDLRPAQKGLERALTENLQAAITKPLGSMLRVVSSGNSYRLVRVQAFAINIGNVPYVAQVEAATGAIFEVAPQVFYLDGTASADIYPRYYNDEPVGAGLPEAKVSLTPVGEVQTGSRGEFTAGANQQPTFNGLGGARVKISPTTGAAVSAQGQLTAGQWKLHVPRQTNGDVAGDKTMAQSMIYAHTSRMIHHARKYISTPWFDQALVANANLDSTCNAHWDGKTINFYSAGASGSWNCANTGLIADVIYHEWGHGLDANTGGIEDGAFSEGFGDIMSLIMTRSNILGVGFTVDGQFVRDLEPDKRYPEDRGQVHAEGLIIGGTFYDLYKQLRDQYEDAKAVDILSNFAFKSVVSASKYTDVYNVVLATDDDDGDLTNGTPHYCLINESFAAHGLAERAPRCLLGNFTRLEIDDSAGNGNGRLDPGETVAVYMHVHNVTGEALTALTGRVSLGSGEGNFEIADGNTYFADLAIDAKGRAKRPFLVTAKEAAPCGSVTNLHFQLSANGRTVMGEYPLMIGELLGAPATFRGSGLPLAIKDNTTVQSLVSVPSTGWENSLGIFAARLTFDIHHTYVGDLTIWLQDPTGSKVEVYRGSGSQDDIKFDRDILGLMKDAPGPGTWALVIRDNFVRDEGTLNDFKLTLTPALFQCSAAGDSGKSTRR